MRGGGRLRQSSLKEVASFSGAMRGRGRLRRWTRVGVWSVVGRRRTITLMSASLNNKTNKQKWKRRADGATASPNQFDGAPCEEQVPDDLRLLQARLRPKQTKEGEATTKHLQPITSNDNNNRLYLTRYVYIILLYIDIFYIP